MSPRHNQPCATRLSLLQQMHSNDRARLIDFLSEWTPRLSRGRSADSAGAAGTEGRAPVQTDGLRPISAAGVAESGQCEERPGDVRSPHGQSMGAGPAPDLERGARSGNRNRARSHQYATHDRPAAGYLDLGGAKPTCPVEPIRLRFFMPLTEHWTDFRPHSGSLPCHEETDRDGIARGLFNA